MPSHRPVWPRGHPTCKEDAAAAGQGPLAATVGDPDAAVGSAETGAGHGPGPGAAEPAGRTTGPGGPAAEPTASPRRLPAALGCLPFSLPGKWDPCDQLSPPLPLPLPYLVRRHTCSLTAPLSAGGPGVPLFPVVSDRWAWGCGRLAGGRVGPLLGGPSQRSCVGRSSWCYLLSL